MVVDGVEYELDCIIFATGFEVGTDYTRRSGYELHGRDGVDADRDVDGRRLHLPRHAQPRLPELFIISNIQSGFTANFPHMLDEQSKHLGYILRHALEHDVRVIEASQEAEDAWVQEIIDMALFNQKFLESCTPGYYNNEGQPQQRSVRNGSYGLGSITFIELLEAWRAAGDLAGLELT